MKISDVIRAIEDFAPLNYQENYDNAGLIIGERGWKATGALLCIDVTEAVVDEAVQLGVNLIIAHHPIIFKGLKRLNNSNYIQKIVVRAIKKDIAIYAAHTNVDNIFQGVNAKICEKLNLKKTQILLALNNDFKKLVTFVPKSHANQVRKTLFSAGAGHIGNYDSCSFNVLGEGTFRAGKKSSPFVGEKEKIHFENEIRIETIYPAYRQNEIIDALLQSHPYEEVAYDIYNLRNPNKNVGAGMIGELEKPLESLAFLKKIKKIFKTTVIKHTEIHKKEMQKVAICGGSGSFLIKEAIRANADIFITGDVKYHDFFDAENKIIIADIGHFESEQYTIEIFYDVLTKKFPKFAVHFTKVNTNPVNYLTT